MFRYLNAVVQSVGDSAVFTPYNPNAPWVAGLVPQQEAARIRPNLGTGGWNTAQVRGYIRQKLATHRQVTRSEVGYSGEVLYQADRTLALELRKLGYPLKQVLSIWQAIPPKLMDNAVRRLRDEMRGEYRSLRALK